MKNFKLPKLHPIIWLMAISAFTLFVWSSFPVIVILYYIFFYVGIDETDYCKHCREKDSQKDDNEGK